MTANDQIERVVIQNGTTIEFETKTADGETEDTDNMAEMYTDREVGTGGATAEADEWVGITAMIGKLVTEMIESGASQKLRALPCYAIRQGEPADDKDICFLERHRAAQIYIGTRSGGSRRR